MGRRKKTWQKLGDIVPNKGNMEINNKVSSEVSDVKSKPSLDNTETEKRIELPNSEKIQPDHKDGGGKAEKFLTDRFSCNSVPAEKEQHDNDHGKREGFHDNRSHSSRTFRRTDNSLHGIYDNNRNERYQKQYTDDQKSESGNYSSNSWRIQKDSRDNIFRDSDKVKTRERYRNDSNEKSEGWDRETNRGNSQHIQSDSKHSSLERKNPPVNKGIPNFKEKNKGYHGGHNDDQSSDFQSETSMKSNTNYNQKNYNADNYTFKNKNWSSDQSRRGTGRGFSGSSDNRGNGAENSFQRRTSYRKDMGDRRSNDWKSNNSQNYHRNSSYYQEGTYKGSKEHGSYNANSLDFSNESSRKTVHNRSKDWDHQAPVPNAQTQLDDDWNNLPVDGSSWSVQNLSISAPDPQGTASSNRNDSLIGDNGAEDWDNKGPVNNLSWSIQNEFTSMQNDSLIGASQPVNQMPIVSPDSSTLNPHASSFHVSEEKQLWSDMGENEATFAEAEQDEHRSKQLLNESVTLDDFVKRDTSMDIKEQLDEAGGPISNRDTESQRGTPKHGWDKKRRDRHDDPSVTSHNKQQEPTMKSESEWETPKNKKDKKKRERQNDPQATSHYKQQDIRKYSGVTSVGYTLSVDQNVSQDSEVFFDETRSELSSQREDYNQQLWKEKRKSKPRFLDGRSKNDSYVEDRSPRNIRGRSMNFLFDKSAVAEDEEWAKFEEYVKSDRAGHFVKVTEEEKDLFSVGEDYSLAHCVAEDMNMGSGIAVEFRRKFKQVDELLNMKERSGGLAILQDKGRFIYYMVTKKVSSGKPTYGTFWNSLKKLRNHMQEFQVSKLAIPRIGCGLDRLDWNIVKEMVEFVFRDLDVHILVCNFQQGDLSSPNVQRSKRCRIVNESYSIREIDEGTLIVYFASADGQPTQTMMELDKKFNFLPAFKRERKHLGDCIRFEDRVKNYILYGCIVKERTDDPFDFVLFAKCLAVIQRNNRKDAFVYVGFQKVEDDRDDILNDKVLNIISHSLRDVDIYCCNSKPTSDPPLNDL